MRAARRNLGMAWPCLGLVGSVTAASAATRLLTHRPIHWWWRLPLLHGHSSEVHVFWLGVILLCGAWLGLGRRLRRSPQSRPRDVVLVGALWSVPLVLGPSLFSLDMFSYLAQGSILAHGMNPYHATPDYLLKWHESRLFFTVSPTWRHTTTPYGPVFLAISALIATVAGDHVALGVTLMRVPELAGLGLLAIYVPRLARSLGADPVRAVWLAVISPLSLLYLVGGGHNDALMAGLVVAGVSYAVEDRPLAGLALCALAATIKLPAVAAVAVIGLCWLRQNPQRWRHVIATGAAVVSGVVLAAGLLTGVGLTWISGSLFSTPETVRLAITPATAVAISLHELLNGGAHAGVGLSAHAAESTMIGLAVGLTAAFAVWLGWRARHETMVRSLGLILIAAALGGPAAWPWYLSWGVVLLAADRTAQRSGWLAIVAVGAVFPVMAGGQVALALPEAPIMLALYALAGVGALVTARRRHATRVATAQRPLPQVSASHHVARPHVPPPPHVSLPHVPGVAHASHMTRRDPSAVASSESAG